MTFWFTYPLQLKFLLGLIAGKFIANGTLNPISGNIVSISKLNKQI